MVWSEASSVIAGSGKPGPPRQGVVVHTEHGSERHLHVNGTTFRVSGSRAVTARRNGIDR